MPELPEVQTTVDGLNALVRGKKIVEVWTDYRSSFHATKENIKNPRYFARFRNAVRGAKILGAERRGKNVLIHLQRGHTILIHMKMTGHLMVGTYVFSAKEKIWRPKISRGPLTDPFNRYIHLVFTLSNKKHLVFSDLRKFATVYLFKTADASTLDDLSHLGPEPLAHDFTFQKMCERLARRPQGKIKQVLMDQEIIAGIGNIYSDEMLWIAGIHPLARVGKIPPAVLKKLYAAMRDVLRKGIDFGGDSDSDYRNIYGKPGKFQSTHNAYRRTGKPCPRRGCPGTIRRLALAGRGAHFCDTHQKLF